jgi:hypothetical protein
MRITKRQLRRIINEELLREKEEDKDLDIDELEGMKLPPMLKKLLDPDVSPQKYAAIDQMVDEGGNINHQAFAIAAFVLSYADMEEAVALSMLNKAKALIPKIVKAREKGTVAESLDSSASGD